MGNVRRILAWGGMLFCVPVWAGDAAPAAGSQIRFLGKAEAAALWSGDQEPAYLGLLMPREIEAKTGAALPKGTDGAAARKLCRERYAAAMLDFSAADRALLEAGVADAHAALLGAFPKMAELPWVFATGTNAVEGGLPHTRGEAIYLSKAVLEGLAAAKKSQGENGRWNLLLLLVHEQTHVFQRANPLFFRDLYESVWGFRLLPNSPASDWMRKYQVVNPDAPDWQWAFRMEWKNEATWYVPFLALDDTKSKPRMGQDFQMHAIPVRERADGQWEASPPPAIGARIPSEAMATYVERFPPNSGVYHPEEALADILSQLTLFEFTDMRILKNDQTRQAFERWFAKPHAWLKEHLGAAAATPESEPAELRPAA